MPFYTTRFVLFSLFLLTATLGQAQTVLKGLVVNDGTSEPLPYATVVAFTLTDSTAASNTLTESDGSFQLKLSPGEYYLLIKYIGFQDKYLSEINIEGNKKSIKLGEIQLEPASVALQEVEVRAEKSMMELKLDKRVFNVGKDLVNAGNNAADILDRVPSVNVDPEGNVSLRGSQSVRILINGKPSGLLSAGDSEALIRMQGDIIESVEVITNPSARYEAEGEAGIINIILKKNEEKGVNGSFGVTAGYPENFGASYNLNLRRKDFNFFSNFGIDYRKFPGGGFSTQRFFDDNGDLTEYFTVDTDQRRGGLGGYLQGGADWNINERNTLTGSLLYRQGEDDNTANIVYRDFDANGDLLNTSTRDTEEKETEYNLETALNYKRTFDTKDREWTADFKYILDDDTEIADYLEAFDNDADDLVQRSSNTEDEINMILQTDYIHPIGPNSKVEGGLRAGLRTVNNDFNVEEQQDNGDFSPVPGFNDELKYTEDIYAAYLIGAHDFGQLSVQLGLRGEYSDITAALLESNVSNDQNYFNLFPSAAFSYSISEKNQLQVNYSRRISRPWFRLLLPFSNFNNPRNIWVGNPNLLPEFTDSYEAGVLNYLNKGSVLTSFYYRRTTGVIERLTLPGDDGTTILFPVNLATRNAFGLECTFSYDFTDWWNMNSDINLFRAITDGQYEGVDYSADAFVVSGGINTKVDIGDKFTVQANFDYNGPRNTTQGRQLSIYMFNLAASLDVLSGKGTITLAGRDLFNTRIRRTEVDLPNYQASSEFQWRRTQQVVMTFNYRLNQEKKKKDLLGGGRGEE